MAYIFRKGYFKGSIRGVDTNGTCNQDGRRETWLLK